MYYRLHYTEVGRDDLPTRSDLCIEAPEPRVATKLARVWLEPDFDLIRVVEEDRPSNVLNDPSWDAKTTVRTERGDRLPERDDARAILDALEKADGNKAKAARMLGMHRATLYRKIETCNLNDNTPRYTKKRRGASSKPSFSVLQGGRMRQFILALIIVVAAPCTGLAAPFLVSDPSSDNATSCVFESFQLPCAMDSTKAIHVDLQTLPVGSHSVRAKFCIQGATWCSDWSLPFPFVKPALRAPTGILLQK